MAFDRDIYPSGLDDIYGRGASDADSQAEYWIHESSDNSWHITKISDAEVTLTNCAYTNITWHGSREDFENEFVPDERPICSERHAEDLPSVAETSGVDTGFTMDARL